MKKVLVGCGVAVLLGLLGLGGTVAYCGHVAKQMAGGVYEAMQAATTMSLDRMEQDAVTVSAQDLPGRMAQLASKPVRVTGTVATPQGPKGAPPPGFDEGAVMFLAPNLMVMALGPEVLPRKRPEGTVVEVVGVATSINLGAAPGMTEEARKELVAQLGGTEMPVVVARKVTLLPGKEIQAP
jgi:hypothetical protein